MVLRSAVPPASYDTVAAALLQTLGQCLGSASTPAVEAISTDAYTILPTIMKEAIAA
jgi:hemoglobin-like flavoprotein